MSAGKNFSAILAATAQNGIGMAKGIPWRIKQDTAYFTQVTKGDGLPEGVQNAVIMGRRTWESLPKSFQPLRDRVNLVLTQNQDVAKALAEQGVLSATSLDQALALLSDRPDVADIFVIGGSAAYNEAFRSPRCTRIYWTHVKKEGVECDTFVDPVPLDQFALISRSESELCDFLVYERK